MNHMQFATDFKKEDLRPYIPEGEVQLLVARVSIDWTAKEEGFLRPLGPTSWL